MTTLALNNEKNGIELYFDAKPAQAVIDLLKSCRWRWNNLKKCWYNRQDESTLAMAQTIVSDVASTLAATKEKAQSVNAHGVKIGDIFYTSWGWEQTNIDFFKVVAVTEKMATVKPIKSRRTETHFMQGNAKPEPGEYTTGNGFYRDVIKTRTDSRNNCNGNSAEPMLKNADGHDHAGYLYTGKAIGYSEYA